MSKWLGRMGKGGAMIAALGFAGLASMPSQAAIYTEVADAGELTGTAQAVSGSGSLDAIRGTLSSGADMFRIYLTAGSTFSATTTASTIAFNNFDMALFLFDSTGKGVYANDDDGLSPPQSSLPAGDTFSPTTSGFYYLAISGTGYQPFSGAGSIFDMTIFNTGDVLGPGGPGGGGAVSSWSSLSSESGDYEIKLTGAAFDAPTTPPTGTPEPATLLLAGLGFGAAGLARRRRNTQTA